MIFCNKLDLYMSYVFTKYWCQIILIYSYFKTGSKPNKYVHKAYENVAS